MKEILSLNIFKEELKTTENIWLLLFKKGSEQSDCAFENYKKADNIAGSRILYYADVNKVKDIHPEYGITSAPTLLNFEKGAVKNIIKGCHTIEQFNAIFESATVTSGAENEKPRKSVTIYTTPTCSWCTVVKRHLQENGIQYREVNVAADQKAAEAMMKRSGQQGVPQTEINGQMVVGFDKMRINSLLGIN
ncbi:glutathione S-transferase N-terminal domain-containing protein [Prolixibacteraceae bacterium Z1-6]|uniref:Glutathione S-transferase N-terminal domain-containing protein n=1 Tax=Draconibacterium aestuarii TaxID=2998507 RepID=A0A9X3F3V6_9BACT|nr:glutathione S-transferase N-terminal domain-containing protein [Prolixibacteraceae bacterium Z1-6]